MKIKLRRLKINTRQTTEVVDFAADVTFIFGPVGTGKSTVARMIDYCFGGRLERTPAVQMEFVAAELFANIGRYSVQLERSAADLGTVRVTWESEGDMGSVNAPLVAGEDPLIEGVEVFNLSDLIFHLAGVIPIKVRKSKRDPDSPLIRLSFRDLSWYCYLRQDRLDSSFYRLEDPLKRLKSMDVMRFVTGLYSERLNELEGQLARTQDDQRAKREAVEQIRKFLRQFQLGTEANLLVQTQENEGLLAMAKAERVRIEREYSGATHVVEPMRVRLRQLSSAIDREKQAVKDILDRIDDQRSVRSELITAKVKAGRLEAASSILTGVEFQSCPRCGAAISPERRASLTKCSLCGSQEQEVQRPALETEALRRDLNSRIDDLSDSIARHERELVRQRRRVDDLVHQKSSLDTELSSELSRYDSAYVAQLRAVDRKVASLEERIESFRRLAELPLAIQKLEAEAGSLQGQIDNLRSAVIGERERLQNADTNIKAIETRFLTIMRDVGFPGVDAQDQVTLDSRNWMPQVIHGAEGEVVWGFDDAGSGGKKTLFNVCYALAVHEIAFERDLPLPEYLIIDSPTKNISRDINAELVASLYRRIYLFAARAKGRVQFLLIDSDLVIPIEGTLEFTKRLMATNDPENPPLISYYVGP